MRRMVKRCRHFWRRTQGVAAVEFAILATVLIFILGGILDFGHAWYIRQMLANASQEGARYATEFKMDSHASRVVPQVSDVQTYVTNTVLAGSGLTGLTVTVTGLSGIPDQDVKVQVSANKNWFMLKQLFPVWTWPNTISASTTVKTQ